MTNFSSKILPLDGFATHGRTPRRDGSTGAPGSARHAGRECRDEPREINFSFIERGRRAMRVDDDDDDDDDGRASDRARRASRVDHYANGRRPQARWVQRCVRDDATRDARRDEANTLRDKYAHRSIDAACISRGASTPNVDRTHAMGVQTSLIDITSIDRSFFWGRGPRQKSVCVNRLRGVPHGWTVFRVLFAPRQEFHSPFRRD